MPGCLRRDELQVSLYFERNWELEVDSMMRVRVGAAGCRLEQMHACMGREEPQGDTLLLTGHTVVWQL